MIVYPSYSPATIADIARLRRRLDRSKLPEKITDSNLLVGTWNLRNFGEIFPHWEENADSPKRNYRALACIAEIIRHLDVVAIQEVKRDTSGVRALVEDFLGPDWGVIFSDVTAGEGGNAERLTFLYDRRRVQPSGLAGEIVIPPTALGDPGQQFCRTPYIVGFRAGAERFALLTVHIKYGNTELDRLPEIQALAQYASAEIRKRATTPGSEEYNLIVLGDFNIDKREDNPLFAAFISTGLNVPPQLLGLKTTYNTDPKFYDQIGWFMDDRFSLKYNNCAGQVDFSGAIFQELSLLKMSFRVSDHFPLWVEFGIDHSAEQMARGLGLDEVHIAMPDPLAVVPD